MQRVEVEYIKGGTRYAFDWHGNERLRRGDHVQVDGFDGSTWATVTKGTASYAGYCKPIFSAFRGQRLT